MADQSDNDAFLPQRLDSKLLPENFSPELRLYFIQSNRELRNTAGGTRTAIQNAQQAAQQAGSALEGVTSVQEAIDILDDLIVRILNDYVSLTATGTQTIASKLSVTGALQVDGVQVVGPRDGGWTPGGGTGTKGGMNADKAYSASADYVQSEIRALADGLSEVRKVTKALQDALTTHGLIGG